MGRLRLELGEDELARAVAEEVAKGGLDSVSVAGVAARLRVSVGFLYKLFRGKQEILTFARLGLRGELDRALDLPPTGEEPREYFDRVWGALESFFFDTPMGAALLELERVNMVRVFARSVGHDSELDSLIRCVEVLQRTGALKPRPPELLARVLWGVMRGIAQGGFGAEDSRPLLVAARECCWDAIRLGAGGSAATVEQSAAQPPPHRGLPQGDAQGPDFAASFASEGLRPARPERSRPHEPLDREAF
ncbi:MAG: TetR/AcrR family transcriptional regulator [Myxococcales bacterium]|nr:TetR/AcrR family transcriptional regulator [Myxococcales bacterium]